MVRRTVLLTLCLVVACSASKGKGTAIEATPGAPRVSYLGRVDTSDPAAPRVAWSGTQIVVRFEGTALSIAIAESEDSDGGSRYEVAIDGKVQPDVLAPSEGTSTYEVAKGLAAGSHVVVLTRRTEPQVGVSQLLGFTFPNGGKLLAPPMEPTRKIEILGDSEMTGYGVECASAEQHFTADTENATKAYPSIIAGTLGAEVRNLSFSGKGVLRNEAGSSAPRYITYYRQAVPRLDPSSWDFASWKPDVIWIGLGANDFTPEGGPPDIDAFGDAYRALVSLVREKTPDAHVILGVPALVSDSYPEGFDTRTNVKRVMKAIVDEHVSGGDAKFHLAELPVAQEADQSGCDSHPTAAFHAKLAPIVAAKIREVTGWK